MRRIERSLPVLATGRAASQLRSGLSTATARQEQRKTRDNPFRAIALQEHRANSIVLPPVFSVPRDSLKKSKTSRPSLTSLDERMLNVRPATPYCRLNSELTKWRQLAAVIKKSVSRKVNAAGVSIQSTKFKFKVRCSKYLYTFVIADADKAEKLRQSLPPSTFLSSVAISPFAAMWYNDRTDEYSLSSSQGARCRR